MRRIIVLLVVAAFAVGGIVPAAGAQSAYRPFKGSMNGEATFAPDAGCLVVNPWGMRTDSSAVGKGTHLGRMSMTSRHCTPVGADITGGAMVFEAANGDEVHLAYSGTAPTVDQLVPGEPFTVEIEFAIVGGTGRFEGASGSGVMTSVVQLESIDAAVLFASWVWRGRIRC